MTELIDNGVECFMGVLVQCYESPMAEAARLL